MNAQAQFNLETKPRYILADGPFETDADGGFEYSVCFGDEDGEPICENKRCMWIVWDLEEVDRLCRELSAKYGLEILNEASAA